MAVKFTGKGPPNKPSRLGKMIENFSQETKKDGLHGKLLWLYLNGIEDREQCRAWLVGLQAYELELME